MQNLTALKKKTKTLSAWQGYPSPGTPVRLGTWQELAMGVQEGGREWRLAPAVLGGWGLHLSGAGPWS